MAGQTRARLKLWHEAFRGFYRRELPMAELDPVSRWLFAGRLLIVVISFQAGVIAALIAIPSGRADLRYLLPLLVGYVVAHAISNLLNDYVGYTRGLDTPDSPRVRYTIHPLAHGVLSKEALRGGILALSLAGVAIAAFFVVERGVVAAAFALAGILCLYLYDAAPRNLKELGLGELASFLVWGPLFVGGGYFCLTGELSAAAFLVSIPYGLGVSTVLVAKHLDQIDFDRSRNQRTLPVVIGDRAGRMLLQGELVAMYLCVVALVVAGLVTPFALAVFLSFPAAARDFKVLAAPRPASAPEGFVGWPLWFHRHNLVHNKRFGWTFILGLLLGVLFDLVRRL